MSGASPAWIGVDVSDGHVHLWVHDPRGDVLAQADGPVADLPAEAGVVAALTDLLSPYLSDHQRLPVIVAGRCQRCPLTGFWVWMPTTHAWIYAQCRG